VVGRTAALDRRSDPPRRRRVRSRASTWRSRLPRRCVTRGPGEPVGDGRPVGAVGRQGSRRAPEFSHAAFVSTPALSAASSQGERGRFDRMANAVMAAGDQPVRVSRTSTPSRSLTFAFDALAQVWPGRPGRRSAPSGGRREGKEIEDAQTRKGCLCGRHNGDCAVDLGRNRGRLRADRHDGVAGGGNRRRDHGSSGGAAEDRPTTTATPAPAEPPGTTPRSTTSRTCSWQQVMR
jgi:hypothetical protein